MLRRYWPLVVMAIICGALLLAQLVVVSRAALELREEVRALKAETVQFAEDRRATRRALQDWP